MELVQHIRPFQTGNDSEGSLKAIARSVGGFCVSVSSALDRPGSLFMCYFYVRLEMGVWK